MGFAELLGAIVNMKDPQSAEDDQYDQWLRGDPDNRCFTRAILRVTPLQSAAYFSPSDRSYWAKYPGQTGDQLRTPDATSSCAASPSAQNGNGRR